MTLVPFQADDRGRTIDGRLTCACGIWHRLEGRVIDLLPPELKNATATRTFCERWGGELPAGVGGNTTLNSQQKEQIAFFRHDAAVYDTEVTDSVFYRISDRMTFHRWIPRIPADSLVLDLAGGTGRQTMPLIAAGHRVVLTDISEAMLRLAIAKVEARDLLDRVIFVLADATRLPLIDEIASAAICYGSLHHFPDPGSAIREAGRVLKTNGLWYSYDPHRSPFRFLFDWAMMRWKLYDELAADEPLLTGGMLEAWGKKAGIELEIHYHAYMLPHVINILGKSFGGGVLSTLDAFLSRTPFLRRGTGIVIAEGRKIRSCDPVAGD